MRSFWIVSMPYIGLIPFLQPTPDPEPTPDPCVNALYRAYPISTLIIEKDGKVLILCQCPISGLSHFYGQDVIGTVQDTLCVNALYRAYPISTM